MKKIASVVLCTGAALALAACGGEAPAVEAAPETTEMAPAEAPTMTEEDAAAIEAAGAAAEGTDTNSNPIGPAVSADAAVAE
ncbi:hypothetical protein J3454_06410 [Erythrobacter sp. NFXS35]|uniref:hypothetical protein n=1 Tax=Erythrobacter sp. NFXS35 TaxID=2818436 RepID=UPI0032DE9045